ncbi:solute carrier family 35 member F3 isoform X2 [Neocloeon triangulifer]|uniref:solute carrier family 35 member F3 isoform X2 n=1 Tax=Neocloeon triangulifer TaxID=2078957 RepID=UPI00286EC151|nr:solute carrier family 35 member F3 isoform X2 [Neocloeon triangulifer]
MREGDSIPSIFNPRRPRTPSVVVTTEDGEAAPVPTTPVTNGPFTSIQKHPRQQDSTEQAPSEPDTSAAIQPITKHSSIWSKCKKLSDSCISLPARKIYCGVCVMVVVTGCWVGTAHSFKLLYRHRSATNASSPAKPLFYNLTTLNNVTNITKSGEIVSMRTIHYDAPFCTAWFLTNWNILFLPFYLLCRIPGSRCSNPTKIIAEALRPFREKGFTFTRFFIRLMFMTGLWLASYYCLVLSLRTIYVTDSLALFATTVSFAYLLSWVILHEQFVGIRIVAVIMCDTGIALIAYMDGITDSPTLGGVVLAVTSATAFAIFKVMLRKTVGPNASRGQIAVCHSALGLMNATLLWPVALGLFLSGSESVPWPDLPWITLLAASTLLLATNLISNFGTVYTYEFFITIGLIAAVPSSGAVDIVLYHAEFAGMRLSGMILIAIGFFLVFFPDNWPDYITRLLRWSRRHRHGALTGQRRDIVDYRTGYIRSHLRSPSGRVR